jgi:hypothetical protein
VSPGTQDRRSSVEQEGAERAHIFLRRARHSVRQLQELALMYFAIDDVDLVRLVHALTRQLGTSVYASYLRGKTVMRDVITAELGCSSIEAEELVETLEMMGYVRFPHLADDTHPMTRDTWKITDAPRGGR